MFYGVPTICRRTRPGQGKAGVKTISLGQIERNSEQRVEGNNFVANTHSGTLWVQELCANIIAVSNLWEDHGQGQVTL